MNGPLRNRAVRPGETGRERRGWSRFFSVLRWAGGLGVLLLGQACGVVPSNPLTPPEILVTGENSSTGETVSKYSLPFSGTPSPLVDLQIPAGLTLRGGVSVDNSLVYLARTGSGSGQFLVAGLPLSQSTAFARISGPTGSPIAMALLTNQSLVVLETTTSSPGGCLELFNPASLVSMVGGGSLPPEGPCTPLPGTSSINNGFLMAFPDGVEFLTGTVGASGTVLYVIPQTSILQNGTSALSPVRTWGLSASYTTTGPISGAFVSGTVLLLPDPLSASVDLYPITTLYGGSGTLSPGSQTPLALPAPPTLLAVDPANNFLLSATGGTGGTLSLFGLGSVLSPPGTLGPIGTIDAPSGSSFGALVTYSGSS